MKISLIAASSAAGLLLALSPVAAQPRLHARKPLPRHDDGAAYGATAYRPQGTPFVTVQPTDVGQGVLSPNGYVGPGSASGGPAGGISSNGP